MSESDMLMLEDNTLEAWGWADHKAWSATATGFAANNNSDFSSKGGWPHFFLLLEDDPWDMEMFGNVQTWVMPRELIE